MQMQIVEFERQVEGIIAAHITRAYPYDWDEDHLTHGIVSDFRSHFHHIELVGIRMEVEIDWEVYKFKGPRENLLGDIGISVSARLRNGNVIHGAGFMEAKLRDRSNNRFTQLGIPQCRRILKHAPQARMLLYDYDDVPITDPTRHYDDWRWMYRHRDHQPTITKSPVVPLQLVAATGKKDTSLYELASSPSFQLAHRYLNCLDLEFTPAAVDAVRGMATAIGRPSYIMRIRVARRGQELPPGPDVNLNSFGTIDEVD